MRTNNAHRNFMYKKIQKWTLGQKNDKSEKHKNKKTANYHEFIIKLMNTGIYNTQLKVSFKALVAIT